MIRLLRTYIAYSQLPADPCIAISGIRRVKLFNSTSRIFSSFNLAYLSYTEGAYLIGTSDPVNGLVVFDTVVSVARISTAVPAISSRCVGLPVQSNKIEISWNSEYFLDFELWKGK